MNKPSNAYRNNSGGLVLDGCEYDSLTDLIQTGILGFCCCGCPEGNLRLVLSYIDAITYKRGELNIMKKDEYLSAYNERLSLLNKIGSEEVTQFIGYVLDLLMFTEHGSGIGGAWLTEKGKNLHAILREWADEQVDSE